MYERPDEMIQDIVEFVRKVGNIYLRNIMKVEWGKADPKALDNTSLHSLWDFGSLRLIKSIINELFICYRKI